MSVKLREKNLADGKKGLYLDIPTSEHPVVERRKKKEREDDEKMFHLGSYWLV